MNDPFLISLIRKKIQNEILDEKEINHIVEGVLKKRIPDYQLSAWLMAIFFQGLNIQEIATLTQELILSGDVFNLHKMHFPKISLCTLPTIGDKSHLVLTPLLAACGVVVPTFINENDHTLLQNPLKKLQAIPGSTPKGIQIAGTMAQGIQKLETVGCCMMRMPQSVAPISQYLSTLQQSIGTQSSIPMMVSRCLSKGFATGSENMVVNVQYGDGATFETFEEAKTFANIMVRTARLLQRRCVALVTNQLLISTIGPVLEIQEAIDLLQNRGVEPMQDLMVKLGMEMGRLSGVAGSTLSARKMVDSALKDGAAFEKFKQMVQAQGGDSACLDDPEKLPKAKHVHKILVPKRGYLYSINVNLLAKGVDRLMHPTQDTADLTVGIKTLKKVGEQIKTGDVLAEVHYNNEAYLKDAMQYFKDAYRLAPKRPPVSTISIERIS